MTDSATNLRRKSSDSCKLFVYIWLLGASPQTPIGAPLLDPAGGLPSPKPRAVSILTLEPGVDTPLFQSNTERRSRSFSAIAELFVINILSQLC